MTQPVYNIEYLQKRLLTKFSTAYCHFIFRWKCQDLPLHHIEEVLKNAKDNGMIGYINVYCRIVTK